MRLPVRQLLHFDVHGVGRPMMTEQHLKDFIASKKKELKALTTRYTGVRPSWVSTDVAMLNMEIERAQQEHDILHFGPLLASAMHKIPLDNAYAWLNQNKDTTDDN